MTTATLAQGAYFYFSVGPTETGKPECAERKRTDRRSLVADRLNDPATAMPVAAEESVNTDGPVADVFAIADDYITRLA